jgi:hypothetical protein
MEEQMTFRRNLVAGSYLIICIFLMFTLLGGIGKANKVIADEQPNVTQSQQQSEQLEFELVEGSVFELNEELRNDFVRGQYALCSKQREGAAKTYPAFKSGKPLYGAVHFSGRAAESKSPVRYYFAVDESGGTGKGYDTLYFDRDGDLDLTNDKPLMAIKNPPDGILRRSSSIEKQVCFDNVELTFDFGSAGKCVIEILPLMMIYRGDNQQMSFISTKLRKGEIEIAGAKYDAFLGYSRSIGVPFDQPGTIFFLVPRSDKSPPRWWGGYNLQAIHFIGGKFYRFSATPTGDKLFAQPYEGALGTFEIGAGGRDINGVSMRGSLRSKNTAVAVGGEIEKGWPKFAEKCQVPVGDYLPSYLRITLGRLSIFISDNYHSDGKPRVGREPKVYEIKIREDKPYVFDFSNKPEVLFASPAKDHRVKLGDELLVKAVLIDPNLNIMIRGLDDTTRKHKLDPKVVIKRANGEIVAEGVMPFG